MVHRGTNRWRELPDLRRKGSPADPSSRRHRRPGQSRQPQKQSRAPAHPLCWSQAVLPAKILTRSEPDRTGLCQAQTSAPESCRKKRRCGLRRHRRTPWRIYITRMRELPQKLRLSKLMPSRFRLLTFPAPRSGADPRSLVHDRSDGGSRRCRQLATRTLSRLPDGSAPARSSG